MNKFLTGCVGALRTFAAVAVSPFGRMIAVASLTVFVAGRVFEPNHVILASNYVLAVFAALVAILWIPFLAQAALDKTGTGGSWVILGLSLFSGGIAAQFIWSIVFRHADMPREMLSSVWLAYFRVIAGLGAMLLIAAPGVRRGAVLPRERWIVVAGWLLAGALVGFVVATALWTGRNVDVGVVMNRLVVAS